MAGDYLSTPQDGNGTDMPMEASQTPAGALSWRRTAEHPSHHGDGPAGGLLEAGEAKGLHDAETLRAGGRRHPVRSWAGPHGMFVWTMREQRARGSAERFLGTLFARPRLAWHGAMSRQTGASPAHPAWLTPWCRCLHHEGCSRALSGTSGVPVLECRGRDPLPAKPPACPFRRLGCPLLACLAPAPVLIPAPAPAQETGS